MHLPMVYYMLKIFKYSKCRNGNAYVKRGGFYTARFKHRLAASAAIAAAEAGNQDNPDNPITAAIIAVAAKQATAAAVTAATAIVAVTTEQKQ